MLTKKVNTAYHEPDGVRHLIEDMWGLWGDWRHPTAPKHRVQPGLVDGVKREVDVALGEVSESNHAHSGTALNPCALRCQPDNISGLCVFLPDFPCASLVVSEQQPVDAVLMENLRTLFVHWSLDQTRCQMSHLISVFIWSPHHLHTD